MPNQNPKNSTGPGTGGNTANERARQTGSAVDPAAAQVNSAAANPPGTAAGTAVGAEGPITDGYGVARPTPAIKPENRPAGQQPPT